MPRKKKVTQPGDETALTKEEQESLAALMGLEDVDKVIRGMLPVLIDRMLELALGVCIQDTKVNPKTGAIEQKVFRVPPDRQALQYLMENVIGKVPQRVELTGKDGGAVEVVPWMPMQAAEDAGLIIDAPAVIELPEGKG